ncbi:MAG TPA: hypothetical protein VFT98_14330 [Myxococcota bacterium]|nr:hypothetical protein [Myxococcota bacterium]
MNDRALPPIRSTREHEPDLEPEIDAFVFSLGELVDSFQDAEAAGALATLEQLATRLDARSLELGYEPVARCAQRVRGACGERNPEALRKSVEDLTEVAARVRRGHRSAAS